MKRNMDTKKNVRTVMARNMINIATRSTATIALNQRRAMDMNTNMAMGEKEVRL